MNPVLIFICNHCHPDGYPRHLLDLHPIKQSQWNTDLSKETLNLLGY